MLLADCDWYDVSVPAGRIIVAVDDGARWWRVQWLAKGDQCIVEGYFN
jgi:hypothetical protein